MCRVKDPGEGFSPEELQRAAVTSPETDLAAHAAVRTRQGLRAGGFGILLTEHVIDELIYGEKGNEVILLKYLKPDEAKAK